MEDGVSRFSTTESIPVEVGYIILHKMHASENLSSRGLPQSTVHFTDAYPQLQLYGSRRAYIIRKMGKTQKKRAARRHNPMRVPDSHLPKGLEAAAASSSRKDAVLPIIQKVRPPVPKPRRIKMK